MRELLNSVQKLMEQAEKVNDLFVEYEQDGLQFILGVGYDSSSDIVTIAGSNYSDIGFDGDFVAASETIKLQADIFLSEEKLRRYLESLLEEDRIKTAALEEANRKFRYAKYLELRQEFGEIDDILRG